MRKRIILLLALFFVIRVSPAQDVIYARMLIDSMASPHMFGRGYVNRGDSLAADFIASQFSRIGLLPFSSDYYQPLRFNVNTFPGRADVMLNGKSLEPGKEFTISAGSHADKGTYPVSVFDRKTLDKSRRMKCFGKKNHSGYYILYDIDTRSIKSRDTIRMIDSIIRNNVYQSRGALVLRPAPSWHAWAKPMSEKAFTTIDVRRESVSSKIRKATIDIETTYLADYETCNVIGFIPGRVRPDTFLVVTAHYDHLGMMGDKTFFPGANDNASGTAMLIDLARHYSLPANSPYYSMAFIAFTGEEAGLLGSKHYTENPFFPLSNIKFLVNLDMVGTGSDGLLVFNATTDTTRVKIIEAINAQNQYVKEIRRRGPSRSSDHYYFHEKGVPAFFLLTTGSEHRYYHDLFDRKESLSLSKYNDVFRLITDFLGTF